MTNYAAELLDDVMALLQPFLSAKGTEDIAMQGNGGVCWVFSGGCWHPHEVDISPDDMWEIAKLAGSLRRRNIDENAPLLDTNLPRGERFFAAVAPALDTGQTAFSIRKPDTVLPLFEDAPARYNTDGWNQWRQEKTSHDMSELLEIFRGGNIWEFLQTAVKVYKLPILFVGPTGAGKSSMSKLCSTAIGTEERIITIEDAIEMVLRQENNVRLLYPSDEQGSVTVHKLQEAALRMRPCRILIQEVRQEEVAWAYIRHNGHRGSLCTTHGTDASGGIRNLRDLFKGSKRGRGYNVATVMEMIAHAVDVIVPLDRDGNIVSVGATWFSADAASRDETIAELL